MKKFIKNPFAGWGRWGFLILFGMIAMLVFYVYAPDIFNGPDGMSELDTEQTTLGIVQLKPAANSTPEGYKDIKLPFPKGTKWSITQAGDCHSGICDRHAVDFGVKSNNSIVAIRGGRVVCADEGCSGHGGAGKTVVIDHGNNYCSLYYHLNDISTYKGQIVSQAQEIGKSGCTGKCDGAHLHIAVVKTCLGGEPRNREIPMIFDEFGEELRTKGSGKESSNINIINDTLEPQQHNLIATGSFDALAPYEFQHWTRETNTGADYDIPQSGDGSQQLWFHGENSNVGNGARIHQDVYYQFQDETKLQLTFKMRNTDPWRDRRVTVVLRHLIVDRDNNELANTHIFQNFTIPANPPNPTNGVQSQLLRPYGLWATLQPANYAQLCATRNDCGGHYLRIEFYARDRNGFPTNENDPSSPIYQGEGYKLILDDVDLRYVPNPSNVIDESNSYDQLNRFNKTRAETTHPNYFCGLTTSPANVIMPFCDVSLDSPFRQNIINVVNRDIGNGYSNGTFGHENPITRGEMATMIARGMGIQVLPGTSFNNPFTDVPTDNPHFGNIHAIRDLGIVSGFPDGEYKYDQSVTRGEMAKIIALALQYTKRNNEYCPGGSNPEEYISNNYDFSDVPNGHTFASYIYCLKDLEPPILSGFSTGEYKPDTFLKRQEAAKFIDLALVQPTQNPADAIAVSDAVCKELDASEKTYSLEHRDQLCILQPNGNNENSVMAAESTDVRSMSAISGRTYEVIAYNLGPNQDLHMEIKDPSSNTIATTSRIGNQDVVRLRWTAATSDNYFIHLKNTFQFAKEGTQVSLSVEEVQDYDFADVPRGHEYYPAIKALHDAGLVRGCRVVNNQPEFCVNDGMEREDVIAVLARWLYTYAPGDSVQLPPATGIFPDLQGNDEVERAVELAYRDGIVGGFPGGNFEGNKTMIREHVLLVIMRALLRHAPAVPGSFTFAETTQELTRMGGRLGITEEQAGAPFRPLADVTRGEAAYMLCNALLGRATCSENQRQDSEELRRLRLNARIPRADESVCFSAASAADSVIPGITITSDGAGVCYKLPNGPYRLIDTPSVFAYRVSPEGIAACQEGGLIGLQVSPAAGRLRVQLSRCDNGRFGHGGHYWVLVNGQRRWHFEFTGGSRTYTEYVNPFGLNPAIKSKALYQLELYSDNDKDTAKFSGTAEAWPFYPYTGQHYEYDINHTGWQCNTSDKIGIRLQRSDYRIKLQVQKCDITSGSTAFSQNGHFWIQVDGRRQWGPFYYKSGETTLDAIYIDPYGSRGLGGRRSYRIELHADNQESHDRIKYSGTSYATVDLLDPPAPPNQSPQIDFQTANGNGFPTGYLASVTQNWTFEGTASDADGRVVRVDPRCSGDQCGSVTGGGTTDWQYQRNGMQGRNQIYFRVYDDKGEAVSSRRLDLNIDLAAPTTTACLNGECNPARWPSWFTKPVQIILQATDGATGRARVDVKEIRYRLNNGPWLTRRANPLELPIQGEGQQQIEFYAVDQLDNQEAPRTITFQVDYTPPAAPSGVTETHGVVSEQWQNAENTPTFTWQAGSDAVSGLWGYQFYFGQDSQGVGYQSFRASDPRQWTPQPAGVGTGSWYLRGRSRDNAGNWSAWSTLFVYRYDGTPPDNPGEATHAVADVQNDLWQRTVNSADFTWPVPNDEGSGVKGYYLYWGTNADGESNTLITNAAYQSATALCNSGQACSGYLRLRAIDNVDNQAEKWTTAYVLRYDNAPPVADFTINGGVTETNQTLVTLNLKATDEGSGVREMRLSIDGINWAPWEAYSSERLWSIPAIGRQDWPIYLQVRDAVGLESAVKQRTIYFDVNRRQPRSENFRLFDYTMSAGAGVHESATYKGRSTVGEIPEAARIQSLNYTLTGGYEAGSQAIPLVEPGHDEFEYVNSVFASGVVAQTMRSPQYQMLGTLGERGLPNNGTTLTSGNFALQPGFLAAAPALTTAPTPTPTPGPTPTPEPEPACAFPQVSINSGSVFTGDTTVGLQICAPYATEMIISNDGGFGGATWEPYGESRTWTITTYGQHVLPRFVYVAFKDKNGAVHGTYFDEIIYDPTPPAGEITIGDSIGAQLLVQSSAAVSGVQGKAVDVGDIRYVTQLQDQMLAQPLALVGGNALNQVDLFVNARDDNSGVAEIQLSLNSDFAGATWEPYTALKRWTPTGEDGTKTLYARFRDSAGNESTQSTVSFVLDSQAPTGSIQLSPTIVGPDTLELTVNMSGLDNLSGVTEMRISSTPTFADSSWLLYNATYHWPLYDADRSQSEATLYVQFRDQAGNVSQTTTAGYQVDLTPPLVLASVESGTEAIRTVTIDASDEMAGVRVLYLSNDPLLIDNVVTVEPTDAIDWTFDENRVVWIQAEDNVGNRSVVYPAYAEIATSAIIPGDGNGDGFVDAGDLAACVLEIFDGDGSNAADAPGGTFAGTAGCDANVDSKIDAGDLACTVLLIFNGPSSCHTSGNVETTESASLIIGVATPTEEGKVQVPVTLVSNGHAIAAATFALQLGPAFDPTDSNGDGLPDAVQLHGLPDDVSVKTRWAAGRLDVSIIDEIAPVTALPDSTFLTVTFPENSGVVPDFDTAVFPSLGSVDGMNVPVQVVSGAMQRIFLPVVAR